MIATLKRLLSGVVLFSSVLSIESAFGQQDPQFSQHMFARLPVNPAYAGSNEAICGALLYRNQWTGFGGEPKTSLLAFDMPVESLHGGIGLSVFASDRLGAQSNLNLHGAYAYRTNLGSGHIAVGIDAGYQQQSLNGDALVYNDPNDVLIPRGKVGGGAFDMSLGAYYNSDKLYVGIASTHLIGGQINYDNVRSTLARHYWLIAGYSMELSPSLTLKPALIAKSDAVSTQVDVNANLFINSRFWVGGGYRLQDAVVVMAGLEIMPNLKLGYSYDYTLSGIRTYSSGSHEIMLGYCFKPVKPMKHTFHRNVRML